MSARSTDPIQSHLTVDSILSGTIRERIVACLKQYGRQSSHDLAERLGVSLVTVSPMIKPLRKLGMVRDSGVIANRRTLWEAA